MLNRSASFIGVEGLQPAADSSVALTRSYGHSSARDILKAPATPTTYTLELTSHCNERCAGCGNNDLFTRHDPFLSAQQWIQLLDRVKPFARYVRLTGGECTLHPGFRSIVSHLDTFDIPFAIFTNGVWRDPAGLIAFLSQLKNLSGLLISLHGPDAETHNTFTGTRFFDITLANIRQAVGAGIVVDTNTVFMRCNQQKLEQIAMLSKDLGARCAVFSRYYGSSLPIVDLTDDELANAVRTVDELRKAGYATKLNPCIPECFAASSSGGCGAGITLCTVDPRGNVRPCNHAPAHMGNLVTADMPEIWSSPEALYWRSLVPEGCISCSALSRCRGGCRATALHRRISADPLMRGPIPMPAQSSRRVFAGLRPMKKFEIRYETEGALLVRRNRVVTVTARGAEVAQTMDGSTTLGDLNRLYGQEALQLAFELYEQSLLELAS